ncbi:hypothetical protein CP556_04975 [Natrinema sp. CBA1119]|nr:hypothetical protein CP556_04975 [Natrinema sp. CBA1119]
MNRAIGGAARHAVPAANASLFNAADRTGAYESASIAARRTGERTATRDRNEEGVRMNERRLRPVYLVAVGLSAYAFWYFASLGDYLYAGPFALVVAFSIARLRVLTADS